MEKAVKTRVSFRAISPELGARIIQFRYDNLGLNVMLLYKLITKQGLVLSSEVSYHSVYRFLKAKNLARPLVDDASCPKDCRRFAYDEVNRMWQRDMMTGPYVMVSGKKKPTYLFTFMDDYSRLVTLACFCLEQNFEP